MEQDGTVSQCFENQAVYHTWYEMYPAGTIAVGTTVTPGDRIGALVSRSGSAYTLAVTATDPPLVPSLGPLMRSPTLATARRAPSAW